MPAEQMSTKCPVVAYISPYDTFSWCTMITFGDLSQNQYSINQRLVSYYAPLWVLAVVATAKIECCRLLTVRGPKAMALRVESLRSSLKMPPYRVLTTRPMHRLRTLINSTTISTIRSNSRTPTCRSTHLASIAWRRTTSPPLIICLPSWRLQA